MLRSPVVFKKKMLDAKHELRGRHGALRLGAEAAASGRRRAHRPVTATSHDRVARRPGGRRGSRRPGRRAGRRVEPGRGHPDAASLADLRDRGAISAEEYEAKKADLLGALCSDRDRPAQARYDTRDPP